MSARASRGMTARTERQTVAPGSGVVGEGQRGMPREGHGMTACAERHTAAPSYGVAGEGQKGIPFGGTATMSPGALVSDVDAIGRGGPT
jgi:hypothetical protein